MTQSLNKHYKSRWNSMMMMDPKMWVYGQLVDTPNIEQLNSWVFGKHVTCLLIKIMTVVVVTIPSVCVSVICNIMVFPVLWLTVPNGLTCYYGTSRPQACSFFVRTLGFLGHSWIAPCVQKQELLPSVYILSSVHSSIQHLVIDRVAVSQWSSLNVVLYMWSDVCTAMS